MLTARERAEEFMKNFGRSLTEGLHQEMVQVLELSFKEHARDQRHLCAEQCLRIGAEGLEMDPYALAMNAPAPGR